MTRAKEITKEAKKFAKEIDDWEIAEDVQDAFEQGALWADKNPYWISIEDSLPKEHQWFLGYSPMKSAMLVDVYNFDSNGLIEAHCITHWMPLPHPPKKGGEE